MSAAYDKELIAKAKEIPAVQAAIEGMTIVKEIYVKGKIINIVVK
jgi:leucyl-tRNA synthetase